jgi:hypothetical protein
MSALAPRVGPSCCASWGSRTRNSHPVTRTELPRHPVRVGTTLRESAEAAGRLAPLDKAAIRQAAGTG